MDLRAIAASNFRAFESASIRLPAHDLVLLAGANNAGKTAFLSALDVVAGIEPETRSLVRAGSRDPGSVSATFDLGETERTALFHFSSQIPELLATGVATQLRLVFDVRRGIQPYLTHVYGLWPGRGLEPLITNRIDQQGNNRIHVARFLEGGQDDLDPLLLRPRGEASDYPMPLERDTGNAQVQPVLSMLGDWRSRYYHFRALRPGSPRSADLESASKLEPTGQNLIAVLLEMLTNRSQLFEELRQLIATIVPLIGHLEVRTYEGQMQAVFVTGDFELNLKDLGTGVEQLLMTLVVGLTETPPFTLVIEEPETNLHHAAQRALLGLLKNLAADRQIIAATHSPVFLDWSPRGDRLWHVIKDDTGSKIVPIGEDPSALLESLGVRLSDVLSATRVLVLEGASDIDVLEAWFPQVLRSPAVAVLKGIGGDNARHADRLAEWLAGVDRAGLRRVLYLRDRDELSPAVLAKLEASESVGVLKRRELENYLLDPDALAQVLAPLLAEENAAPSAGDVTAFMYETAEGLRRKVVVNRVCNQVRPERPLMDHRFRQRLAASNADEEAIAAAITDRLMTPGQLRAQVGAAWDAAEADVASRSGEGLLSIAPGEEILQAIYLRYAGRGYGKREDGVAIARAMATPPQEIHDLLDAFMSNEA